MSVVTKKLDLRNLSLATRLLAGGILEAQGHEVTGLIISNGMSGHKILVNDGDMLLLSPDEMDDLMRLGQVETDPKKSNEALLDLSRTIFETTKP